MGPSDEPYDSEDNGTARKAMASRRRNHRSTTTAFLPARINDASCRSQDISFRAKLPMRWSRRFGSLVHGANLSIFLLADRPAVAELGTTNVTRDFGRHWTPVHLDFIVANLDEMVERLCGLGATLDREIQIREYGRMANMGDPFGNGFDLIEFSGPGYDNIKH
jgi:hypothetical protein